MNRLVMLFWLLITTPLFAQIPSTLFSPANTRNIWLSQADIDALPASGAKWNAVQGGAAKSTLAPNVQNQDDNTDQYLLAKALVWRKTGLANSAYDSQRASVVQCLEKAIGTEIGGRTLALGRNLIGYVISADLIGYRDPAFVAWVAKCQEETFSGGPSTLRLTHEQRPNNWGTHAGASRIASAIYLGNATELTRAATVFHGWLGDRTAYAKFSYGDKSWQSNPSTPVGINPVGATIQGHNVDGVLPDDQRRGGGFTWPPPKEGYVWEALQGATVQCELLHRQGIPAYDWESKALLRAYAWLHTVDSFPATGDDKWQPWIVNKRYGSTFPASTTATFGKNMGWTVWTHQ